MKIKDFTRVIPKQDQEKWPVKLYQMTELYCKAEYQMIKKGLRKAGIIQVDPNNISNFLEKINEDGLIFTPLRKTAISAGFSIVTKEPEPGQLFFWNGFLTKNYKDGQQLKKADLKNDHRVIGKMLGYPDCCIDYFIQNFPVDPCPVWVGLDGKARGYPECNGMLRYFGPKITAHLSCSPDCQATKEIGKIWFKTMQEIDKDLADELYNLLAGPMTWNSYHGVVQVETPYFVGLNNALFILKKPRIINWLGEKKENIQKSKIKSSKISVKNKKIS